MVPFTIKPLTVPYKQDGNLPPGFLVLFS